MIKHPVSIGKNKEKRKYKLNSFFEKDPKKQAKCIFKFHFQFFIYYFSFFFRLSARPKTCFCLVAFFTLLLFFPLYFIHHHHRFRQFFFWVISLGVTMYIRLRVFLLIFSVFFHFSSA